ncbi:hypothetical protein ASG31_13810 [Chryseobacterium sp. Leaf404]|uniref:putative Ig domain-containing protein n=1 Tax=unclassified Chryseobacterium TaxID=2593645 RepID=UPI0006FBE8F3|nr:MULTISPECIES: putative Ig domain-containing protein [unclassified Chryseobacterium]KQT16048.1 hypothetical protein ASG31_13810 [Chryseobacterium sp. Leaf404]
MKRNLFIPKTALAFLMALFSVWGWGQTTIFSENMGTTLTGNPSPSSYTGFQNYGNYVFSGTGDLRNTSASSGYTGASGSNHVMLNSSGETLIIGGFNVSSYINLVLSFGVRKGTNSENGSGLVVEYTTNGSSYVAISKDALPTGENGWYLRSSTSSIPTTATAIRFRSTNTTEWRIDDVKLIGTLASGTAAPVVTPDNFSGTVGSFFTQQLQASQFPSSYTLTGSLPTGLTFDNTSGIISGTPTVAGSATVTVTATNNIGTSNPATFNLTIAKGNQVQAYSDINAVINDPAVTLPAVTSSGLAINYSSSNNAVASVSGNVLTFGSVGTATITANNSGDSNYNPFSSSFTVSVTATPILPWEDFENGTKTGYTLGNVTSTAGSWTMNDALLGNAAGDKKNGSKSARIQNTGYIQTNFDITTGVGKVKVNYAKYGTDVNTTWVLKASTDGGLTWNAYTSSVVNATATTLTPIEFTLNIPGNVRLRIEKTSGSERMNVDDIYVTSYSVPVVTTTTWNGSSWSNNAPSNSVDVVLTGNYTTSATTPPFTAKNITIQNGGTLEITDGNTITAADVTVENGGNLIQRGTGASGGILSYSGTFKVNKNYTSAAGKYAFWSSPVQNQNMFNAFATQPTDVTTYNTATNYYDAVTTFTNNSGKGYSVQMPAGTAASFVGTPNNGTVNVALSNASFGFNLVGNPYPSNVSLTALFTANNGNIDPTLYFWDNTSAPVANQSGQTSSNYGYATFNANGSGTWAPAQTVTNGTGNYIDLTNAPAQVNPGQGFIVKSLNGNDLVFNNGMRNSTAGTFVNKNMNSSAEGKFWLKLTTPFSAGNTLAITYGEGASNALDGFDSKALALGSDAFYSKVSDNKLAIQGRADFVNTDVVPLGSKHFTSGLHIISLVNKTGIFNNGQAIYLHDKVLGTYTNLQNTSYNFTVNAGEIADRFEVVYLLGTLSTSEAQKGSFEIYRDGNDFYARNNKNIDSVEVFDASGRKIQEMNPASQLVRIPLDSKGFYIIKAKSEGKEYSKKITY